MADFCPHCVAPRLRAEAVASDVGMFGRMFPDLEPLRLDPSTDFALGKCGGPMDAGSVSARSNGADNPRIPAGWAFFGQILAHDVTHDRAPLAEREEVRGLRNFRSPRFDLEAAYGSGPIGQPYLYQRADGDKFLVGRNDEGADDLPRNSEGLAIIGDPRDDTYLFISQLHLALLRLHNRFVDGVRAAGTRPADVFADAQRLTRWHYQWIIVHEYLPLTVGEDRVEELLQRRPRFYRPGDRPFVPIEFSAAAFRYGHAQIRSTYDVNDAVRGVPIFPDLVGQRPIPAAMRPDWHRFFRIPGAAEPQPSKRLNASYADALMRLPRQLTGELESPEHGALAYRDLLRGASMKMPSGEDVARALGERPIDHGLLGLPQGLCRGGTPLAYYVLREAELVTDGTHLGPVGGRLVAEVVIGLLRADPTSYVHAAPDWRPESLLTDTNDFTMADLLFVTGVETDPHLRAMATPQ